MICARVKFQWRIFLHTIPSNAYKATFVQCTCTQRFLGNLQFIARTEYSQMNTHVPGFQSFFSFLHHFVLAKLATSSMSGFREDFSPHYEIFCRVDHYLKGLWQKDQFYLYLHSFNKTMKCIQVSNNYQNQ